MKKILKYQAYHLICYVLLGAILIITAKSQFYNQRTLLGITVYHWVIVSWIAAGVFQAWILFFWRYELYYGTVSRLFGKSGFPVFRAGFFLLGAVTLLPVIPVSFLTRNSMEIYFPFKMALILGTTPFILWAIYSVLFYFSINRAFGADHFFPEYRMKTLEVRGIFKYIPNSMYTVLLLILYHPGLFFDSSLGLVMALVHHIFVWVHYFCTEKPDMKEIYQRR